MRDKDEGKSEGEQIDGAATSKVEEMINDPDLEAKDEAERLDGKIQEKAGKT
jgi:uncharacterized protein YjbJ (UPF0337 family)